MPSKDGSSNHIFDILFKINWKRELVLVFIGSILGGLLFTFVSPFVVPSIHDFQVNEMGAQNPTLGVDVEYGEDAQNYAVDIPTNETYERYRIIIHNPSDKVLSTVTVGVAFPGGIEYQEVGRFQTQDSNSYSWNVRLARTQSNDNLTFVTNGIHINQLPPGKTASVTFLVDSTPEEHLIPGYWETSQLDGYDASEGTVMVSGEYRWDFKGSIYTERTEFTEIDKNNRTSQSKFDLCIGEQREAICHR
jgi:hypothetical protein